MKTKMTLQEIADNNKSLKLIETTSENNGYPANIKYALIGFETFEEAQKLADKYNFSIESFVKRDGWELWCRSGNTMYKELINSANNYGDNYSSFVGGSITEEQFLKQEVLPLLDSYNSFEDIFDFLKTKQEVFDEIENAEPTDLIITDEGAYFETVPKNTMYLNTDTWQEAIGLI